MEVKYESTSIKKKKKQLNQISVKCMHITVLGLKKFQVIKLPKVVLKNLVIK